MKTVINVSEVKEAHSRVVTGYIKTANVTPELN